MRLKSTQRFFNYPPQIQHPDSCGAGKISGSVESIADSIILLRNENDSLRKMAASLSIEADNIRRSLSPTKPKLCWPDCL